MVTMSASPDRRVCTRIGRLPGVVNLQGCDKNGLLVQRLKGCHSEGIGVAGDAVEACVEAERGVGVDEVDPIFHRQAKPRQVTAAQAAEDRAAPEGIGELSLQRLKQLL